MPLRCAFFEMTSRGIENFSILPRDGKRHAEVIDMKNAILSIRMLIRWRSSPIFP